MCSDKTALSSTGLKSITIAIFVKKIGKMSKMLNKFEAPPRLAAWGDLTAQGLKLKQIDGTLLFNH